MNFKKAIVEYFGSVKSYLKFGLVINIIVLFSILLSALINMGFAPMDEIFSIFLLNWFVILMLPILLMPLIKWGIR